MVKGIINAFDHMKFCLVINLTTCGNLAVTWPPMIATRYVSFFYYLKYQVASTCYQQKKFISNTETEHSDSLSATSFRPAHFANLAVFIFGLLRFNAKVSQKSYFDTSDAKITNICIIIFVKYLSLII